MAKILVVDDDRELRENIAEVLTEAGFEVLPAESGEKALQLSRGVPPISSLIP